MRLLALSEEITSVVSRDLKACGIQLIPYGKQAEWTGQKVDGVLLTKEASQGAWEEALPVLSATPGLLLLYGPSIPYGWAQRLVDNSDGDEAWEVVRMALVADGEKALIGGTADGFWVRTLCRSLAKSQRVSLVCKAKEVDEAVRQLPLYFVWKERFFVELGEVCDQEGISLQTVARAMGMDRRVGQDWLYPERLDHRRVMQWIEREGRLVAEKSNVHRVALWGPAVLWREMDKSWLQGKEVCLVTQEDESIPNDIFPEWTTNRTWEKALKDADLLVIGKPDGIIRGLPLHELVLCMKQAIVLDACACFPLQEARSLLHSYRAIGEKTNVWE
ncbi:hypothetical protein [Brevibacillus centrosporus]|uniref:hypothetical protein n=1 Tax=Brevibacillus centrosporus TaxID=54910 RepID=UPI003807DF47